MHQEFFELEEFVDEYGDDDDDGDEDPLEPPDSPPWADGSRKPRRPPRKLKQTVLAHHVPLPTTADEAWDEDRFAELLAARGVSARLHDDPHQPDHRRLLADCAGRKAAETLAKRLSEAFDHQMGEHSAYAFVNCMRQAEKKTMRRRMLVDAHTLRVRGVVYQPWFRPQSFFTRVAVTVRPDTFGDKEALVRTFMRFGNVLLVKEAAEPSAGGRTWHLTYGYTTEACAAEFTYHGKEEGGLSYSVVMDRHPYRRLLFLMTFPLSDDLPRARHAGDHPDAHYDALYDALSLALSTVSERGCRLLECLLRACRWRCCAARARPSEPPAPAVEEAPQDVP